MQAPKALALCAFVMILALVVVGILSDGIARHIIQTAPAWLVVMTGVRGAGSAKWFALPVFAIWLLIMALIWLFLLGIAHVITGTFSPTEVGMTVLVGVLCLLGIATALHTQSDMMWTPGVILLVVTAGLQVGAIWLSMQPHFANDPAFGRGSRSCGTADAKAGRGGRRRRVLLYGPA